MAVSHASWVLADELKRHVEAPNAKVQTCLRIRLHKDKSPETPMLAMLEY